jgi:bifunctional DNase/RNase
MGMIDYRPRVKRPQKSGRIRRLRALAREFNLTLFPGRFTVAPSAMAFDDDDDNIVQMELNKIIISEMQDSQFIWLKEVDGERKFAIVIGSGEAYAIDRRLKGIATQRPMTHDLLASVIEGMGGTIDRIEINNLEGGTFFARIHIRQNGDVVKIDSRPSDAIALGVATSVPIFVAEHVLEEVC